jgi:hypothetical protein
MSLDLLIAVRDFLDGIDYEHWRGRVDSVEARLDEQGRERYNLGTIHFAYLKEAYKKEVKAVHRAIGHALEIADER